MTLRKCRRAGRCRKSHNTYKNGKRNAIHIGGRAAFHNRCGLQYAIFVFIKEKNIAYFFCRAGSVKPPRRRQTIWTPDKSSWDGCSLPGVFCCSRKGQAIRRNRFLKLSRRMAPAGCRGSRNGMLSPGKGTTWPLNGLEPDSRQPLTNIIFFLYIPQPLLRGLRYFMIRHVSANFTINLLKDTLFLLRAYRAFCRCAFFVP